MNDSQRALEELKKIIKWQHADALERASMLTLLEQVGLILDKTYAIATENSLDLDLIMLETTIPKLVNECIKSIENSAIEEVYQSITGIRDVAISGYFSVSKDGLRSELELKQLSGDIEDLKKKKRVLELQMDDHKTLINLRNHLNSFNEEASLVVDQAKARSETLFELLNDVRTKHRIIDDVLMSAEEAKKNQDLHEANLSVLNVQSTEINERIKGILGDVNRESMASSFKERKEELSKSIKIYDIVNYTALGLIALLSMIIFFTSEGLSLHLIYERFLIILPFGFISWFASRRSQQLFQLKEDYAYKYSSAMAFEGYKRQAETNEEMHNELLKIAITNLGKTPTSIFDRDLKHAPTDKLVDAVKEMLPKTK